MTQESEGEGWGSVATPPSSVPAGGLDQNGSGVSRHLRLGWDTVKVNGDALWDSEQTRDAEREEASSGMKVSFQRVLGPARSPGAGWMLGWRARGPGRLRGQRCGRCRTNDFYV